MADDPKRAQFILKFGAGLNSRTAEDQIDPRECTDGKNFGLDIENGLFFRRKPFDLVATATNGERINGFAQLIKADGSIATLVQAGSTVYDWDGISTFTEKGTVISGARLRGHLHQNWILDDIVIITDLGLKQNVLQYDGTTLSEISHNLGGNFKAKYCAVENDRAQYANVTTSIATPHLISVSKLEEHDNLDVSNRPASGASAADPFFVTAPDLKPINGFIPAFGTVVTSTREGRMFRMTGADKTDYAISQLFAGSGAVGDEAVTFIGNDVAYGRVGKIESLVATENFGNVESDDLTRQIANLTEDVKDWVAVYNPRADRVYFITSDTGRVFVLHRGFLDRGGVSPWSVWETDHPMAFQPSTVMHMKRPTDGLDVVYMGDNSGNIYQLEGAGAQDGGTTDVTSERVSQIIQMPDRGPIHTVSGFIRYRKQFPATVTLTFEWGGTFLDDQSITVTLDAASNAPVYGGGLYYSDGVYYSTPFKGRFSRQPINPPGGQSEHLQVRASIAGSADFFIEEIELNFSSH